MGLFSRQSEPQRDSIEVSFCNYNPFLSKIVIDTPNDFDLGKTLGRSMKELARYTHELKIGAESLETILRRSDCFNGDIYRITDFKIVKCDGKQFVDEVFISLRGKHNYDVRYKVCYACPIDLLPVWYKDYDYNWEGVTKANDKILWELICEANNTDGNSI